MEGILAFHCNILVTAKGTSVIVEVTSSYPKFICCNLHGSRNTVFSTSKSSTQGIVLYIHLLSLVCLDIYLYFCSWFVKQVQVQVHVHVGASFFESDSQCGVPRAL